MRIRTEAPGDVHTVPRRWWPDSADAVGQKISRVAVQAMLELRVLLVGHPFPEKRQTNGSTWNDERIEV
jgi:hypothetical protein